MRAPLSSPSGPALVDRDADAHFRALCRDAGLPPDDRWVGGYVAYEWGRSRHVFETLPGGVRGMQALELGCNVGATAIVLGALGAWVTAVDVDSRLVAVTRANADRHGVSSRIRTCHIVDRTYLPFDDGSFAIVVCNSVLEYVPPGDRAAVLAEIDRVLQPGGRIAVLGTSNRIWPREAHSRRWLVNYVPRRIDRLLGRSPARSVAPWEIRRALPGYTGEDSGAFFEAKARMGVSAAAIAAARAVGRAIAPLGITVGELLPSLSLILRKPR
jgi:SAM-dependent methyltransferase